MEDYFVGFGWTCMQMRVSGCSFAYGQRLDPQAVLLFPFNDRVKVGKTIGMLRIDVV